MKNFINYKMCMFLILSMYHSMYGQKALVIVPVADLIGSPVQKFHPHVSVEDGYKLLPLCGGNINTYDSCPRMHQLLFNETVTIVEERGQEAHVKIPHFFYVTDLNHNPQCSYWMLKKNLITFKELEKHHIDLKEIPLTPSFKNKTMNEGNIVTLSMPFIDPITKQAFSAGTRFVSAPNKTTLEETDITAYAFDAKSKKIKKITIPRTMVIQQAQTNAQKITQFVDLIAQWAHQDGFIPYVWGGCSFTQTSKGTYCQKETTSKGQPHSYFDLNDYPQSPKTGMDCANLIGRAAQLCGIPYYFKNSLTVATYLKPLAKDQKLERGDIIWIYGHVMVVSDIEKNLLIEARSCLSDGQGRVQEIALGKTFKGVETYEQLIDIYAKNKPLYRMGKKGNVEKTIHGCKLLKLATVWD